MQHKNLVVQIACHKRRESIGTIIWIYTSYLGWVQTLQCALSMKIFSNSTIKPASLKQHLANIRPSAMSKNNPFFEKNLSSLKRQKLNRTRIFGVLTAEIIVPLLSLVM